MGSLWVTTKPTTHRTLKMTVQSSDGSTSLPCKSLSLRRSSVAKRLLTEQNKSQPKVREKISKKYRLSKYRRKTENAKERERMKKFNEAFINLKRMLPNNGPNKDEDKKADKDTKVSSLRSAITYINCLQELLKDVDAGRVGEEIYRKSNILDKTEKQKVPEEKHVKKKKLNPKRNPTNKKVSAKEVIGKWVNYSEHSLGQKFGLSEQKVRNSDITSSNNSQSTVISPSVAPLSSPVDVKDVSLQINILDTCRNYNSETRSVTYVYSVMQI